MNKKLVVTPERVERLLAGLPGWTAEHPAKGKLFDSELRDLDTGHPSEEELRDFDMDDLADLRDPNTEHPSEEELLDFVFDEATEDEKNRLQIHLNSCSACREKAESLKQSAEPWQGEEGALRLENLRDRLLKITFPEPPLLAELAEQFRRMTLFFRNISVPSLQVAHAKTPLPEHESFQTENGLLRGLMVYDEQGNLNITFSSHKLPAGLKFRLRSAGGEWHRDVILTQKTADQVGAEITINSAEIADQSNRLNQAVNFELDAK